MVVLFCCSQFEIALTCANHCTAIGSEPEKNESTLTSSGRAGTLLKAWKIFYMLTAMKENRWRHEKWMEEKVRVPLRLVKSSLQELTFNWCFEVTDKNSEVFCDLALLNQATVAWSSV